MATVLIVDDEEPILSDDKFLACAPGGRADFLVTADADLLILDGAPAS